MKKTTFLKRLSFIFLALSLSCFTFISATDYCHSSITSNRGATAYVTMKSLGDGLYQFIFESENDIVSWNAGGSNFYAEVDGIGGYQVSDHLTQDDAKTLSVTINSNPKPNIYVGTFYVNYADGEHAFNIPTDEDFDAVCATLDNIPPSMVSASVVGTPTFNSVNLQLSATDDVTSPVTQFIINDSGNGITNRIVAADGTGNAVVSGLSASTTYNFVIKAKDGAGNISANSQTVSFTTAASSNTQCSGTDNQTDPAYQSLSNGYTYNFTTSGSDVTITFELLDAKTGLVAYLWDKTSGFTETQMTNTTGQIFTTTLTGLTANSDITVAVKFAYAGGLSVTKDFVYTVGNTCGNTSTSNNHVSNPKLSVYPNPVKDYLKIACDEEINQVSVKNLLGQTVKSFVLNSFEKTIDLKDISTGNYLIFIKMSNGQSISQKFVKL
ncbi:exported hypothetical protein [uncultured Paludibacter sp.]|uniref:Fibronectin type-III domain-containing protein n=1 Tax=uncultured Paludibacter sp. TaxID=497635 RepID=A0A653AJY2_9BACT|nr:exported hypothetical protein [uncultured Paludibacter sp.]